MPDELFPILGAQTAPMLGRASVMHRLWGELTKKSPSHLQIVGPRYSGKTVLLRALVQQTTNEQTPYRGVIYWDLGHQTPDSNLAFVQALTAYVAEGLKVAEVEYADELVNVAPEDTYSTLKEVLEVLADESIALLLLMDGFDKPLGNGLLTRNLWDQLRELGSLGSIRFVTATRRPLSQLIRSEESATSDFWGIFDQNPIRLRAFDPGDQDAIISLLSNLAFDKGARKELENWSSAYPPLFLTLLNQLIRDHVDGNTDGDIVNKSAERSMDSLHGMIDALWRDCPAVSQDIYRELLRNGRMPQNTFAKSDLTWLTERGFAVEVGNKVESSCRYLERFLSTSDSRSRGLAEFFGTWDNYKSNIREVLERRLSQLNDIDERLQRLMSRAMDDIPDYPDDCLNNLTHIEDLTLDVIWQREFGKDRVLPQGLWDEWNWIDANNNTVARLKDYAGRLVPDDRALQCGLLQLLTGSRQGFDSKATFATKDTYVLINAIHSFRNRNQHAEGEGMHSGVAVAALMVCLELLACIDRGPKQ